jgi:hypothetical protein
MEHPDRSDYEGLDGPSLDVGSTSGRPFVGPLNPPSSPGDSWAAPGVERAISDGLNTPGLQALEQLAGSLGPAELVEGIGVLIDQLTALTGEPNQVVNVGRPELLELASGTLRAAGRLEAAGGRFAYRADKGFTQAGISASVFLARRNRLTGKQAARMILRAKDIESYPPVRRAVLAGDANLFQADAAVKTLTRLPVDELDPTQVGDAARLLTGFMDDLDSNGLARAGRFLLEKIAPGVAASIDERKTERDYRQAVQSRGYWDSHNPDGTYTFKGVLPADQGELLRRLIDSYTGQVRREHRDNPAGVDSDSWVTPVSGAMWRADGLIALCQTVASSRLAPKLGGDRPRIQVTMTLQDLQNRLVEAKLVTTATVLTASQARQLACDADVIPVVLGADSQILDVGREKRLVPDHIRGPAELRDGGCCFPNCPVPAARAQVHHIIPWQHGGRTSLSNLVHLCAFHHGIVEPPGDGPPVWIPKARPDGLVEFIPPASLDPAREPILHQRFILRGAKPSPAGTYGDNPTVE